MVWSDLDLLGVYDTVVFLIVLGVCIVYLPIILSSKPQPEEAKPDDNSNFPPNIQDVIGDVQDVDQDVARDPNDVDMSRDSFHNHHMTSMQQ